MEKKQQRMEKKRNNKTRKNKRKKNPGLLNIREVRLG